MILAGAGARSVAGVGARSVAGAGVAAGVGAGAVAQIAGIQNVVRIQAGTAIAIENLETGTETAIETVENDMGTGVEGAADRETARGEMTRRSGLRGQQPRME